MVFEESVVVDLPFDEVLARTKSALEAEGFGTITEIDIQATLRARLGKEMGRYTIIGACNPELASAALDAEPLVGVLLPCNVVVREFDGKVQVNAMDPGLMVDMVGEQIAPIAFGARERIGNALVSIVG